MKKRNLLLAALLLLLVAPSFAAKVDTLLVNSPSMNKDVQVVVVTPDAALGKNCLLYTSRLMTSSLSTRPRSMSTTSNCRFL